MRESFQAAIYRLIAELDGEVQRGTMSHEAAVAELATARRELLRAMDPVDPFGRLERVAGMADRLATATRLLEAVGASERGGDGRLRISGELERAVQAFATGATVAHYAKPAVE